MQGFITIERYMQLCLGHPEFGYYMKQDPFGKGGDFITAPEISQMFGEIVAAWIYEKIHFMNPSSKVSLVELGPGRGTMMSDILRVMQKAPDIMDRMSVYLLEQSPVLKNIQQQKLMQYGAKIRHISTLDELPDDAFTLIIANEFFDALPVQHYVRQNNQWFERVITEAEGELQFTQIPSSRGEIMPDGIYEYSPSCIEFAKHISDIANTVLIIDYGYKFPHKVSGETLQALKAHEAASMLEYSGDADITAHVNFTDLEGVFVQAGFSSHFSTQSEFLVNNGIFQRAQKLAEFNPERKEQIKTELERLLSDGEMGRLFKVLECTKIHQN